MIQKTSKSPNTSGRSRRLALAGAAGATLWFAAGCEVNSFLDMSETGRFQNTPTSVPILERISAIEGPQTDAIAAGAIRQEDLIPEGEQYRLGPGDVLEITIQDLFNQNQPEKNELDVDPRGFIDLPQVPGIFIDGKTIDQAQQAIAKALRDRQILDNASVSVIVRARRKLTYTVVGAVERPGQYQIARPDFRLLEALPPAGQFPEQTQKIYIIRGIPLSDAAAGKNVAPAPKVEPSKNPLINGGANPAPSNPAPSGETKPKESIIDLIDDLSKDKAPAKPAPALFADALDDSSSQPRVKMQSMTSEMRVVARDPIVDIDDKSKNAAPETTWAFVDGQWVQTGRKPRPDTGNSGGASVGEIMTQRVIEIPTAGLLSGAAQYNIVVRPGDVIRVPAAPEGLIYVGGNVNRPGPYTLPRVGRVTLQKAIMTAGGLNGIAIPERLDLTRMVGPDRQATIRLNYRAIAQGTHPDIFLRPDDVITVGTNFWAFPLQVIRNGFRASYGFGFILDRNFGYDVFGPQKTNSNF